MTGGFGLYIHWPYCTRICPYCDFNVYKASAQSGDDLAAAICKDMAYWRELSGPRALSSIHFGGGTPSLLTATQIGALLKAASDLWDIPDDTEIAIEANPNDMNASLWRDYKDLGLTRISLGVQSFDDTVLKFLGRDHDGDMARRALGEAVKIFPRVSADLIFGHKGQSEQAWASDLEAALSSGAGHLSCYQLTIEPGTAFERAEQRGDIRAVDNDHSAQLYDLTRERLTNSDYEHYEISNFARAGERSLHNLNYWLGGDYAGLGPGAHGRITRDGSRSATIAHMTPGAYMKSVKSSGHGIDQREVLPAGDHAAEYVLMGLRIIEGISLPRYAQISGEDLSPSIIADLTAQGYLRIEGERLCVTDNGRPVLNTLTQKLLGA